MCDNEAGSSTPSSRHGVIEVTLIQNYETRAMSEIKITLGDILVYKGLDTVILGT